MHRFLAVASFVQQAPFALDPVPALFAVVPIHNFDQELHRRQHIAVDHLHFVATILAVAVALVSLS